MINSILTILCMICLEFLFIALLLILHFTPYQEALLFLLFLFGDILHDLFRALPKLKYVFFSLFPTFKLF